ncbi:hypothetical protein BJD94_09890 [Vibrio vulnificus Env1]|nr:hypothetical protein BJD94_09890 [Vibrio vulnificus Env1]
MDPCVREDDELRDRKRLTNRSDKEKVRRANDDRKHQQRHYPIKTQHTAATPPVVIPVRTEIHSSTHARCHVGKHTRHNQQLHRAKPTTLAMKRQYRATTLAVRWFPAFARMTRKRQNEKADSPE